MRSTKFFIGVLGLCAAVVAAPVEFSGDLGLVEPNLAAAKPGGGKGNGQGRGRGPGASAGQSSDVHGMAQGHAKDGQAGGQGNGRADAVSGVEHAPPGHAKKEGYKGHLGVQGSFNAIHSAAINKGVVSPRSQIARIEAYLSRARP